MKKNLIAASVFVFGLVLGGASAYASSPTQGANVPRITEEMAACISACQAAGGTRSSCWSCCVQNICAEL